jgi:hypothetical protein
MKANQKNVKVGAATRAKTTNTQNIAPATARCIRGIRRLIVPQLEEELELLRRKK